MGKPKLDSLFVDWLKDEGWTIGKCIGKGAFSTVHDAFYRSPQKSSDRLHRLACKIIDKRNASLTAKSVFIERELDILSRILHPNIIEIDSIVDGPDHVCVFMERASNSDLSTYIAANGAIDEPQARIWFGQLCDAINYLHRMDIVHRDLKLENLLLTRDMQLKITDFGFAKWCSSQSGRHTARTLSETYCGTAIYTAPEVIQHRPYNVKAADIWSLGVILFILLNGSMPFDDSSVSRLKMDHLQRIFHINKAVWYGLSEQCKQLLFDILEYDVYQRITLDGILSSEWLRMHCVHSARGVERRVYREPVTAGDNE